MTKEINEEYMRKKYTCLDFRNWICEHFKCVNNYICSADDIDTNHDMFIYCLNGGIIEQTDSGDYRMFLEE